MSNHRSLYQLIVPSIELGFDEDRPNVLRFSCRRGALHEMTSKKLRSRAPKAVNCKRLLARNLAYAVETRSSCLLISSMVCFAAITFELYGCTPGSIFVVASLSRMLVRQSQITPTWWMSA